MLRMEKHQMTRGSRPAKSSQGRAGINPRRKRTLLSPPTACACLAARSVCESASFLEDWRADLPAQFPPYDGDVRAFLSGSMFTNHHSRITIHKQAKKKPARQPSGGACPPALCAVCASARTLAERVNRNSAQIKN